jgi:phosphonate transport system ATP-binding protein
MTARPLIFVDNLTVAYPNGHIGLSKLSLEVNPGEVVVVLGKNGCGKTTLLRSIDGTLLPRSGSVSIGGLNLATLDKNASSSVRLQIASIYPHAPLIARRSAIANVTMGSLGRNRNIFTALGMLPRHELPAAYECMSKVGLSDTFATRRVDGLSAGEAQKVAIARALLQRPKVLLADEPIANLDPKAAADILSLLRKITCEENLATVCVLHQPAFAKQYADRILGMRDGRAVFFLEAQQLQDAMISRLYERNA